VFSLCRSFSYCAGAPYMANADIIDTMHTLADKSLAKVSIVSEGMLSTMALYGLDFLCF
jgi:hypothetical protein